MTDDDDSPLGEDEEEILVYVDFEGTASPSTFCNEKLELDMIGLDSDHPIMQVNGKYYEGTYEDAVGTYMFFDEDTNPVIEDPVFDKTPTLKYYAKTKKVLKMKRVFVKPRLEVLGDSNHPRCIPNMDTIKAAGVPCQYQEEALSLWKAMRNERLEALSQYLEKQRQREEKRQQGIELDSESDDDNPFAMYKPTAQEFDETALKTDKDNANDETVVTTDSHKLRILDPGPSTSKDSTAWSNFTVDSPDNFHKCKTTLEPKNQGYIEICSKRRSKRGRAAMQTKESETFENIVNNDAVLSDESHDSRSNEQTNRTDNYEIIGDILGVTDSSEEAFNMAMSHETDANTDISMDLISDGVDSINVNDTQNLKAIVPQAELHDKRIEKQRKREAKMNEISERLKKFAAQMNPKI